MRKFRTTLITLSTAALVAGATALASQDGPQRPGGRPGEAPVTPTDRDSTRLDDRTGRMGQFRNQNDVDSPRHAARMASRLTQTQGSLGDAIDAAEKHSGGVAIGVRVTLMDAATGATGQSMGERTGSQTGDRTGGQTDRRVGDDGRRTGAPGTDASASMAGTLCAIVTCVVDKTKVRDVIVDLDTNTVVGLQSSTASRQRDIASPGYGNERSANNADQTRGGMVRATDLMNATVRNASGDRVGDIDDLAIDAESNRVVYGVLRRGGFLGMGESRYAIACSELSAPRDGEIRVELSDDDFTGHSGFDNSNWPTRADSRWSAGGTPDQAAAMTAGRVVKASDIIGSDVVCRDGTTLGEVEDLVVDAQSGRIAFAVVQTDNGSLTVPMSALQQKDGRFALPMAAADIRSRETFDSAREPNWNDEAWGRRINESYGVGSDAPRGAGSGNIR